MMKQILIVLLLLTFISCSKSNIHSKQENNREVYDFHILYTYHGESMEDWRNTNYNRNNLYIVFEGWYDNDTVSISANNEIIAQDTIIVTEPSTETSAGFIIPDINKIEQLSLKINSSPTISFEIARKDFIFIGIRKEEKNIEVVFYKKPPTYY